MISIKTSGFGDLGKELEAMADRMKSLDGVRVPLRCPECGSTKLVADDELGEDAPLRCENEHVLGLVKDVDKLLEQQAVDHVRSAFKG